MQNFVMLRAVGGVALNQQRDGAIKCFINPENAEAFKNAVIALAQDVHAYQLACLERQKTVELGKYELPKTKIQILEEELERLRAADASVSVPTLVLVPDLPPIVNGVVPTHRLAPIVPVNEEERKVTMVTGGAEPDDGSLPLPAAI